MSDRVGDAKRKRIGRPRVGSRKVFVAIPPNEMAEIAEWIAAQPDKLTAPSALRKLAMLALKAEKRPKRK